MGEAEASVKLTLNDRGFRGSFDRAARGVEDEAKRLGRGMGAALSNGVKGGIDAVASLGSKVKGVMSSVAGLAGGIGFASLAQGAINTQKHMQQLANGIRLGTGELVAWNDIQAQVQAAADASNNSIEDMTNAFATLLQETGDHRVAAASLEKVGDVARSLGVDVNAVSKVAGTLSQKFGVSGAEMSGALDQVASSAQQGGFTLEQLADDFAEVGGKAKALGITGVDGVRTMLGVLNAAKKESGSFQQAMTALPQIFDQLMERTSKGVISSSGKIPMKVAAVDKNGKQRPFADIIGDIIKETKGDAAALGEFGFGGEGLQTVLGLAKSYQQAVDAAGGDTEQARARFAKGLEDMAGQAREIGKAPRTAADDLVEAMNTLTKKFTSPEGIAAIESLTENLPQLAEAAVEALNWIQDNPGTAAAGYVGATFAQGAIGGMLRGAFEKGGTGAAGAIGQALTAGGAQAGASIGTSLRASVNSFNGGVAAFGGMVAAWAVVGNQLKQLFEELDTHDQDVKDERQNLLENAERQGKAYATREMTGLEKAADIASGGDATEYIIRGPDGKPQSVSLQKALSADLVRQPENITGSLAPEGSRRQFAADPETGRNELGQFVMPGLEGDSLGPIQMPNRGVSAPSADEKAAGSAKTAAAVKALQSDVRASGDKTAQALSQVLSTRISNWHEMPKGHGPR